MCNRAACALKLGRFADAVSDADEATSLEPRHVKGWYRLALALRGAGKPDRALAACRTALELQPSSTQLNALRDELQQQIDFEAAESRAAPAGAAPPARPDGVGIEVRPGVYATVEGSREKLADGVRRNREQHEADGGGGQHRLHHE